MCECVGMQEIALCFSKLKFMDVGYIAIPSFSCCLKGILGSVTSTADSRDINQDFRRTCRGPVFITHCRQTRDGTDVDDSAERDGYGLKCNKTLIFKSLGRTRPPFMLARMHCNKRYANVTDHMGITR